MLYNGVSGLCLAGPRRRIFTLKDERLKMEGKIAISLLDEILHDREWYNSFHDYQYPDITSEVNIVKEAILEYIELSDEEKG